MIIVKPHAILEMYTPNPQETIERAGRTCYKSEGLAKEGSADPFIRMLIGKAHESVLEHAVATFRFICDRGVSHELVRHRIASFSQESTRYCNYSKEKFGKDIQVIEPPGLSGGSRDTWLSACESAGNRYMELIGMGISPQIARSVLPTCLKTEVVMTANFREWRTIFKQRCAPAAHPQMRELMIPARAAMFSIAPAVFSDLML